MGLGGGAGEEGQEKIDGGALLELGSLCQAGEDSDVLGSLLASGSGTW